MDLQNLKSGKGARHRKKRVGRGNGSGVGTYSGRGMKGQNARSGGKRRPGFEGGQTPFIKKMPKFRGFKNPQGKIYQILNVEDLETFDEGETVDKNSLQEMGLIQSTKKPVKILGDGELTKKLTVKVDRLSKSAEEKIKKAKGSAESLEKSKKSEKAEKPKKAEKA